MEFEPNITAFEIVILNAFDKMVDAVSCIPRVETKLYPDESEQVSKPNLSPVIADSIIQEAKDEVHTMG